MRSLPYKLSPARWLILGLLLALPGCANLAPVDFDPPEIELLGLRPVSASGMEARFQVTLKVINPNNVALDVEGLYFELFIRESKMLSGVSSKASRVPAFGEETLTLDASIGMINSVRLIRDLAEKPVEGGLPYTLKTKLSLGNLPRAIRIEKAGLLTP